MNNETVNEQVVTYQVVQKPTNHFAIVGFICSLVSVGILGLILSLTGYKDSKKYNSGKALSIFGIIISTIKIIIYIAFYIYLVWWRLR